MAERVRSADIDGLDAGETLGKIADARLLKPQSAAVLAGPR